MKFSVWLTSAFFLFTGAMSFASPIVGFNTTVSCDARSLHGGNPTDASNVYLGFWTNGAASGSGMIYIFSGNQMRVGIASTQVRPDGTGALRSEILAKNLDNGQYKLYGRVTIQFDRTGDGKGVLESAFEPSEPYILGSLALYNCRIH